MFCDVRFTVAGNNRFPVDMLRYDECFPFHEVNGIITSIDNEARRAHFRDGGAAFEVRLIRRHVSSSWLPTIDRWYSFGWIVLPHSIDHGEKYR